MSWIDGVINFISPRWGAERELWRQYGEQIRAYDAGGTGRANANWTTLNESAEYTDRFDRSIVRARARDLERNSDIFNSIVSPFKRNVYGGGYTLQARTGSEELDREIERLWKKWCKKNNCDVTGVQCFSQIMRIRKRQKGVNRRCSHAGRVFGYGNQDLLPVSLENPDKDGIGQRGIGLRAHTV